jgi:mono/diheme cytochrome c family protein
MFAASTTVSIAWVIFAVLFVGWIVYAIQNVRSGRAEVGSEVELAANRTPYYDDQVLETTKLERTQLFAVLFLAVIAISLPLYWIFEPQRTENAQVGWDTRLASWGSKLFATTAEGGFNCAGCHGGMKGGGGPAPATLTDPLTGEVKALQWNAPALNTVMYRFSQEEIRFILIYGRPGSPMSPWGTDGGGPMNTQQIQTLIEYLKSIQLTPEGCLSDENFSNKSDPSVCDSGMLPADERAAIEKSARDSMEKKGIGYGEALYNLELNYGAYSCARCHTEGWSWGDPGVTGQGGYAYNLTGGSTVKKFADEQDMIDFIRIGSQVGKKYATHSQGSGRMPGFGGYYSDEQLKAIVEYVRGL